MDLVLGFYFLQGEICAGQSPGNIWLGGCKKVNEVALLGGFFLVNLKIQFLVWEVNAGGCLSFGGKICSN